MEKQELEACIEEYGKAIYSFCRQLTCNGQEADDLYQDTFLKAMELSGKIDYSNNPKSYLLSIALRIWKNKKRKYAWRRRIAETRSIAEGQDAEADMLLTAPSPEEHVVGKEEQAIVRQAVEKLPERLKIVVLLFYMEELSVKQIAAMLRIPTGTVLSRLHQARKELKEGLESVLNGKRIG